MRSWFPSHSSASWGSAERWLVVGSLVASAAACQTQIVAVEGDGAGGSTVVGATAVATAAFSSAAGGLCNFGVGGAGAQTSATVGSTGTGAVECSFVTQGADGHSYVAQCNLTGCDCLLDSSLACQCAVVPENGCTRGCCPLPWLGATPFP